MKDIFNNESFKDLLWIMYGMVLSIFGNILYRINNRLKIKPFWNRVLYGVMGLSIYTGIVLYITREKPKLNIIVMLLIFLISYFTELLVEIIESKLPMLFDRVIDRTLGKPITVTSQNEKKEVN